MRLSLLPSAVALLLWATGGSSDSTDSNLTYPYPNHILSPADIQCTGALLNETEVEIAKEKAINWGMDYRINKKTVEIWTYGNAAWWICNCKRIRSDPVMEEELVDFQARLAEQCGPNQSGWLPYPSPIIPLLCPGTSKRRRRGPNNSSAVI
ncbi:hypothetical protein DL766_010165 [Monosporascus sp. MC13-8B]|uniref:Uncharacterized protein n=1 Tax=Monosporascus cannonballus TaxID=155416 RepID=A0ABY0HCD4_9PEZI|nr:hypothetical protein DL762_002876 [Monosporascus cannonballus]RYO95613.1 hypothetical protein DL763_003683 [Monosporascus cannonballus]RYP08982.1 hypothetical protein DL766_010165 [Monosporascus sp. MC13-8B]